MVTVLGPASAQTLRGPGNFDAKQVALASAAGQRGRFGALRAAEVAHNPSIWDVDDGQGGKICVSDASKVQLWRPDSESCGDRPSGQRTGDAGTELGGGECADRLAAGVADQEWRKLPGRVARQRRKSSLNSSAFRAHPATWWARLRC